MSEKRRAGGLPPIHAGARRKLLWRLVANGLAQGVTAFVLTRLVHEAIHEGRAGEPLAPLLVVVACCGLLQLALRVQEAADAERVGQDYVMRVRLRLFDHLAGERMRLGRGRRLGVSMSRLISDLNALRNWVGVGLARSFVALLTIAGLLVAMATIDLRVAAVLASMALCVLALGAVIAPLLRQQIRAARRQRGRLANNLGDKLLARATVTQFGRARREKRRVRRQSEKLKQILVRRARLSRLLRGSPSGLLPIALVAVVWSLSGDATGLEQIAVGLLLAGLLAGSLGELLRAWDYRLAFLEGRARIGEVLTGPRRRRPGERAEGGPAAAFPITIEDIAVEKRLQTSRLEAAAGETVLLTGRSGSGKSTLLDVLCGRLEPDEGRVVRSPESREAVDAAIDPLQIQLVSPRVPLLRGTVRSNLLWAMEEGADPEAHEIVRACDLVRVQPGLPQGLDTGVEEGAQNLPSALCARIALARAALAAPAMLLVDDPAFECDGDARDALGRVRALLPATFVVVGRESTPPLPPDRTWRLRACVDAPPSESRPPALRLVAGGTASAREREDAAGPGGGGERGARS